MNIIIRIVITYLVATLTVTFMFIISTASSVNYEANKSYQILNILMVSYENSQRRIKLSSISVNKIKIKVIEYFLSFACLVFIVVINV